MCFSLLTAWVLGRNKNWLVWVGCWWQKYVNCFLLNEAQTNLKRTTLYPVWRNLTFTESRLSLHLIKRNRIIDFRPGRYGTYVSMTDKGKKAEIMANDNNYRIERRRLKRSFMKLSAGTLSARTPLGSVQDGCKRFFEAAIFGGYSHNFQNFKLGMARHLLCQKLHT